MVKIIVAKSVLQLSYDETYQILSGLIDGLARRNDIQLHAMSNKDVIIFFDEDVKNHASRTVHCESLWFAWKRRA